MLAAPGTVGAALAAEAPFAEAGELAGAAPPVFATEAAPLLPIVALPCFCGSHAASEAPTASSESTHPIFFIRAVAAIVKPFVSFVLKS